MSRARAARRRVTRARLRAIVGALALIAYLGFLIAFLVSLFVPAPNVITFQPQHLTVVIEGATAAGDEPLPVNANYSATGAFEQLSISFALGSAESATVYFAQGGLAQEGWTCSVYYTTEGAVEGEAAQFRPVDSAGADRAEAVLDDASGYPLFWDVDEPSWQSSAELKANDPISGFSCERSGNLWPTVSNTYRAFVPPVITIAVEPQQDFEFTSTRDMWFVGEASATPGISYFGSSELEAVTDGLKQSAVRWRDQPLTLHDTTAQQLQDGILFFMAAFLGAVLPVVPRELDLAFSAFASKRPNSKRAPLRMKRFLRRRRRRALPKLDRR